MHNTLIVDSARPCSGNWASGLQSNAPIFAKAAGVFWIEKSVAIAVEDISPARLVAMPLPPIGGITRGAVGWRANVGPGSIPGQLRLPQHAVRALAPRRLYPR